jgi:hypothetical protein
VLEIDGRRNYNNNKVNQVSGWKFLHALCYCNHEEGNSIESEEVGRGNEIKKKGRERPGPGERRWRGWRSRCRWGPRPRGDGRDRSRLSRRTRTPHVAGPLAPYPCRDGRESRACGSPQSTRARVPRRGKEMDGKGSGRSHIRPGKVRNGSRWAGTTAKRVEDPSQPASDGPDYMRARSNGYRLNGRRALSISLVDLKEKKGSTISV